jgi:hypothetical protein
MARGAGYTEWRKPASGMDMDSLPPIVHDVLRSPGQPLDSETRAFFEPRFDHDFSRVRVHTDSRAAQSAYGIGALAYAVGRQLVFAAGKYNPITQAGKWLLAHELVHAAQHDAHGAQPKALVSEPTHSSEREADRLAERVMRDSPGGSKAGQDRLTAPGAAILPYRGGRERFFGRESDPARGLVEETFRDRKKQPWIETITVVFDRAAVDTNTQLGAVPPADRLMATGKLHATYHKNPVARTDIDTPVGGGSTVLGLTDKGDFKVHRIEGVGYNAALQPGQTAAGRIPGTKYTKDPHPTTPRFMGAANMSYAVFFNGLQALHIDGPDGLRIGSHACVHVPDAQMQQINYHSVDGLTRVSVSYGSATALAELCSARERLTGLKRNPCL